MPYLLVNLGPIQHPPRIPEEEDQEGELLGSQIERSAGPLRPLHDQIDPHVPVDQFRLGLLLATADQSTDAGQQLLELERLAEIVIGPAVEAEHAIGHLIAGGQDQHRSPAIAFPETAQQCDAVLSAQPPIEQDDIPTPGLQAKPSGVAVGGVLDRIPLLAQTGHQVVGDVRLVLNQQDASTHRSPSLRAATNVRGQRFSIHSTASAVRNSRGFSYCRSRRAAWQPRVQR